MPGGEPEPEKEPGAGQLPQPAPAEQALAEWQSGTSRLLSEQAQAREEQHEAGLAQVGEHEARFSTDIAALERTQKALTDQVLESPAGGSVIDVMERLQDTQEAIRSEFNRITPRHFASC
jgi:hypothetical protein